MKIIRNLEFQGKQTAVCIGKFDGIHKGHRLLIEQAKKEKEPIYTYGPIIHNEAVVEDLEKRGVIVIHSVEELRTAKKGTVIIRSHGVEKAVYEEIKKLGHTIVDATCPFVLKIHKIVEKESAAGCRIVIIGNAGHPEVEGIMGWSSTPAMVAECAEEIEQIHCNPDQPVCIVSQTTFNYNKFQELVEIFEKKGYDISVVNTICNATEERQTEAKEIAAKVDAMIIIGGRHSSNTRKLYEICSRECADTYFIQTLDDLHLDLPKSVRLVGITAGASTPNKIIEEVQNYVRINF